ncbi:hypothetical protein NG798_24690 [Ancylothrix sp. C2]|uniref:hypothetical protein n=1 Tax=Ancylothrix sp. D3o TaxID=2953691 RepID=UPI0021BAFF21|nr:hypothetical protein [Ancylothrix sp. D3o]MCT7953000.1 hypothetical protein [Ancylothrix sp. D3o]
MTPSDPCENTNSTNGNQRNELRRTLQWSEKGCDEALEVENKRYEKYMAEEKRNWDQLRQELTKYKGDLRTSDFQLAKGLDISRQPVIDFMAGTREDLPIYRANLIRLWDFLTAPEKMEKLGKRLSKEATKNRERLRKEGPDRLLRLAGFLPRSQSLTVDGEPLKDKKIYRIVSRLSSFWIPDKNLWSIEEAILNAILKEVPSQENALFSEKLICVEAAKNWLEERYKNAPPRRIRKILSLINTYARAGKTNFEETELFELYQSVTENEILRNPDDHHIRIRVIDCEFKNLTFLLDDFAQDNKFKPIVEEIEKSGFRLEQEIGILQEFSKFNPNEQKSLGLNPVKEAVITWRMGKDISTFSWRYSSIAPHIENMLVALAHGLGYPSLKLCGLAVRALGKRANSLARISVSLTDNNSQKTYNGLWVDQNTITCLLQAVVVAFESWLSETMSDTTNYPNLCKKNAKVLHKLHQARKLLNDYQIDDYSIQDSENEIKIDGANKCLEEVIDTITDLRISLLQESILIQQCYEERLERHEHMAKLMQIRSAHIQGIITQAAKFLHGESYQAGISNAYVPIALLYAAENMIYNFFSGNKKFLYGKLWRTPLKDISYYKEQLRKYILKDKNNNLFDFDLHLCISEIFGNLGRLDLYFCNEEEDRNHLVEAIDNFLVAVYFSSKIGNRHRVAHWLTHVSRTYSRLSNQDQATKYAAFAEKLVNFQISPRDQPEYREALMAEVNLAWGERCLIENKFKEAIEYFIKSLSGALYLKFARLIADSLYGIGKAAKIAYEEQSEDKFEKYFSLWRKKLEDNLDTNIQKMPDKNIYEQIINFLKKIEQDADWNSISEDFKNESIKIWHNWANAMANAANEEHPVERDIKSGVFLKSLT